MPSWMLITLLPQGAAITNTLFQYSWTLNSYWGVVPPLKARCY